MLPSGLAELEQLHVELNSEHSTSLHSSSTPDDDMLVGAGKRG